jgi:TonB family protein
MIDFIKKHKKGLIGTIAFHGLLAILFFTMGFSTPLPLPAEQGILINFGNVEEAGGSAKIQKEPEKAQEQTIPEEKPEPQPQPVEQEAEKIATQDMEEAPAVKQKQEQKKQEQKEPEKKQPQETQEESEKKTQETKEPERQVNKKALYPGKSDEETGENEGNKEGEGNQGNVSGSPDSDNYANQGSKGMGGIDFSLSGRNPESLPKPDYNYQVEGKVVVAITVDKYGNVTKAEPGAKGSTTLDDNLLKAAKKAALNAQFDVKLDAPAYQKGTITYYFRLQ